MKARVDGGRRVLMAGVVVLCLLCAPEVGLGDVRRYLQAEPTNYHYGSSAYISVVSHPRYELHKVQAIHTHQTTFYGWCEAGLVYVGGLQPQQFLAYEEFDLYDDVFFDFVGWTGQQRFHIGYNPQDYRHYFWINNAIVYSLDKSKVNGMTSSWPATNNEMRNATYTSAYDNTGTYQSLKWKEYDWGVWTPWGTSIRAEVHTGGAPDPYHYQSFGGSFVGCYRN